MAMELDLRENGNGNHVEAREGSTSEDVPKKVTTNAYPVFLLLFVAVASAALTAWVTIRYHDSELLANLRQSSYSSGGVTPLESVPPSSTTSPTCQPAVTFWEPPSSPAPASSGQGPSSAAQPRGPAGASDISYSQALGLGHVLLARGEPEEAALAFRLACDSRPDSAQAFLGLGLSLDAAGPHHAPEALEACSRAESLDPSMSEAAACLGSLLAEAGDGPGALAALRRAVALDPRASSEVVGRLGAVLLREGETREAAEVLSGVLAAAAGGSNGAGGEEDATAAYNLGVAWALEGETAKAIDAFALATELGPSLLAPRVNLGAQLLEAGHYTEAEQALLLVLNMARDPRVLRTNDDAQGSIAAAHSNLGAVLERTGRLDQALTRYAKAAEQGAGLGSLINLSRLHRKIGRLEESYAAAQRALETEEASTSAGAWHEAGLTLEELGRTEEALAHFAEAYELDPGHQRSLVRLGACHRALGRPHEAMGLLVEASRAFPEDSEIYELLHGAVGDAQEANAATGSEVAEAKGNTHGGGGRWAWIPHPSNVAPPEAELMLTTVLGTVAAEERGPGTPEAGTVPLCDKRSENCARRGAGPQGAGDGGSGFSAPTGAGSEDLASAPEPGGWQALRSEPSNESEDNKSRHLASAGEGEEEGWIINRWGREGGMPEQTGEGGTRSGLVEGGLGTEKASATADLEVLQRQQEGVAVGGKMQPLGGGEVPSQQESEVGPCKDKEEADKGSQAWLSTEEAAPGERSNTKGGMSGEPNAAEPRVEAGLGVGATAGEVAESLEEGLGTAELQSPFWVKGSPESPAESSEGLSDAEILTEVQDRSGEQQGAIATADQHSVTVAPTNAEVLTDSSKAGEGLEKTAEGENPSVGSAFVASGNAQQLPPRGAGSGENAPAGGGDESEYLRLLGLDMEKGPGGEGQSELDGAESHHEWQESLGAGGTHTGMEEEGFQHEKGDEGGRRGGAPGGAPSEPLVEAELGSTDDSIGMKEAVGEAGEGIGSGGGVENTAGAGLGSAGLLETTSETEELIPQEVITEGVLAEVEEGGYRIDITQDSGREEEEEGGEPLKEEVTAEFRGRELDSIAEGRDDESGMGIGDVNDASEGSTNVSGRDSAGSRTQPGEGGSGGGEVEAKESTAAVELSEEDAKAAASYVSLGKAYLGKGKGSEALKQLRKSTRLNPTSWVGFFHTAEALMIMGDHVGASRELVSALGVTLPSEQSEMRQLVMLVEALLNKLGQAKEATPDEVSAASSLRQAAEASGLTLHLGSPRDVESQFEGINMASVGTASPGEGSPPSQAQGTPLDSSRSVNQGLQGTRRRPRGGRGPVVTGGGGDPPRGNPTMGGSKEDKERMGSGYGEGEGRQGGGSTASAMEALGGKKDVRKKRMPSTSLRDSSGGSGAQIGEVNRNGNGSVGGAGGEAKAGGTSGGGGASQGQDLKDGYWRSPSDPILSDMPARGGMPSPLNEEQGSKPLQNVPDDKAPRWGMYPGVKGERRSRASSPGPGVAEAEKLLDTEASVEEILASLGMELNNGLGVGAQGGGSEGDNWGDYRGGETQEDDPQRGKQRGLGRMLMGGLKSLWKKDGE